MFALRRALFTPGSSTAFVRLLAADAAASGGGSTKYKHIEDMVKKSKVVVFMKGVPEEPLCGFSNAVVQVMKMHEVPFEAYDILKDEELRQQIKEFSNWPTIPQVYINGEFMGGCDIIMDMHKSGDLIDALQKAGIRSALLDRNEASKK